MSGVETRGVEFIEFALGLLRFAINSWSNIECISLKETLKPFYVYLTLVLFYFRWTFDELKRQ